jgi:glutamine phosphoribosylpyrophosphate amidotransferase
MRKAIGAALAQVDDGPRRPGHAGPRLWQCRRLRLRQGQRTPVRNGSHPEPLRRTLIHPALPGLEGDRGKNEAEPDSQRSSEGKSIILVDDSLGPRDHGKDHRQTPEERRRQGKSTCVSARRNSAIPCFYGIDIPNKGRTNLQPYGQCQALAKHIGADSVLFVPARTTQESRGQSPMTTALPVLAGNTQSP